MTLEEQQIGGEESINWFNAMTHCMTKHQCLPSGVLPVIRDLTISQFKNYIDTSNYPFNSNDMQEEYTRIIEKKNAEKPVLLVTNYKINTEQFWKRQPFFYDKNQLFWFWDKKEQCYKRVDETEILVGIEKEIILTGDVISSTIKNSYLEAFRQVGRGHIPKIPEKTWIQFKNCVFDLKTGEKFNSSPDWFFTNPIPHNLTERTETPQISLIFSEWVGNQSETLFEILAYCCLSDYPIHRLFVLIGSGSNGKSKFLELLTKFIGVLNVSSANLDKLTENNFHTTKLYKKLVCLMGETNFNVLEKTDIIKRLTGQDLIDFEFKGKQGFDDYNYAKIVIATNSLPITSDETDGFYRRWLIVDFPKKFTEEKNILESIPEEEYDALASKCALILVRLYKERKFTDEGTIEDRKKKYILASNPISIFIKLYCDEDVNEEISYSEFYTRYIKYLKESKRREIAKKEFSKVVEREGYEIKRCMINQVLDTWILGLKWSLSQLSQLSDVLTPIYIYENEYRKRDNDVNGVSSDNLVNNLPQNPYILVKNLLLDKKEHQEKVETLLKFVTLEVINQGKKEGIWFEPYPGTIKLL